MKKFLSILMALALCLSFSVLAFAADDDAAEEAEVTGTVDVEDALNTVIDLVEAASEDNADAIKDATDALNEALAGVKTQGDVSALIDQLKAYAEGADVDASAVFSDLGALEDVFTKFLDDGGFDLETIEADLKDENSPLSQIVNLYAGIYQKTPTTTANEETPEEEPTEVPNPPTGDSATGVIAALSTLAVSAAAFVVCTKKKED